MILPRRHFLRGILAAPAIVAAGSLMPVRSIERLLVPNHYDYGSGFTLSPGEDFTISWDADGRIWHSRRIDDTRAKGMRIGFTGTRLGMSEAQSLAFTALMMTAVRDHPVSFHHGDCVGADAQAHAVVRSLNGRVRPNIVVHPPTDDRLRAKCDGDLIRTPHDHLTRNKDIVDGTDLLIAAPETAEEVQRSGTWSTVRYARKTGKRVVVINPDGSAA